MIGFLKRINRKRIEYTRIVRNNILLEFYYLLYEKRRIRSDISYLKDCKKICILFLGGIGDAIVLTGLIKSLRDSGKEVYCICTEKLEPMLMTMVKSDGHTKVDMDLNISSINNKQDYDVVVDFSDPEKNLYKRIRLITSIKHKYAVGFNQKNNKFFDLNIIRDEEGQHWTKRLCDFAERVGVYIKNYKYDLNFSEECLNDVNNFYKKLNNEFIIFNPISSDKFRSLSTELIKTIICFLLKNYDYKVVVYNVTDQVLINAFPEVIFKPFKELDKSIALIKYCKLVITTDTCFVHAANFFNAELIGIYNNRLSCGKYNNNIQWGPNYEKGFQVFSSDNLNTETGDDLRKISSKTIEDAIEIKLGVLK